MKLKIIISLFILLPALRGYAQKAAVNTMDSAGLITCLPFYMFNRDICKGFIYKSYFTVKSIADLSSGHNRKSISGTVQHPAKPSFFKIHGNILYDVTYRSSIDTPYAEKNIYQHTVQTYLDITIKDQYPTRFYITNRFSNSSVFKNFMDLNYQLNPQQFNLQVKEKIKNELERRLSLPDTNGIYRRLQKSIRELDRWQKWLDDPSAMQRLIEARELALQNEKIKVRDSLSLVKKDSLALIKMDDLKMPSANMLSGWKDKFAYKFKRIPEQPKKTDSISSNLLSFPKEYLQKKKYVDSLKDVVKVQEEQYEQYRRKRSSDNNEARYEIDKVKNVTQLKEIMKEYQIADTALPKGYQHLFAVRSAGIGRNILDYSELTASNVSVTGLQMEYNPSWYAAVAAGYVDYRFRNYTVRTSGPKQYMSIFRLGQGMKEGNHLYFSYYFGSRQLYNASSSIAGAALPNYRLVGYSVEGRYGIGKNTYVTGEFAKSSLPYYNKPDDKQALISQAVTYREHTNEAYLLKINSYIPATFTRLSGSFKHIGSNFQSFSIFTSGSAQTNWMARVEQPFIKRRLNIIASLRTNEMVNPYIGNNFKSSTVFKSIQATFRTRKWPTVSVGYYPSSQLTKLSEGQFSEQLFYTFVTNLTHFYKYEGTSMSSTLSFSRFYNRPTDSNFIYFNTRNLLLSQHIYFNKFSYQLNLSVSANTDYTLYVADNSCDYRIKEWLSLGAGVKYNSQPVFKKVLIGYSSSLTLKLKKLGEFQFMMDKGFIPGSTRELVSNNVGRASYFKTF